MCNLVEASRRPMTLIDSSAHKLRPRQNRRSAQSGVDRIRNHEPAVVDPAVRVHEAMSNVRTQGSSVSALAELQRPRRSELSAAPKMIVEKQSHPDLPARA